MKVRSHAALIGKKHDSTLLFRQSANLGKSRSIHCLTSVASCSNARLSGFWQLNPICANNRPTEIALSLMPYWRQISVPIIALVQSAKGNCS